MPEGSRIAGLRIAHLIESDGPGGAERVLAQLATSLQAADVRSVVFIRDGGEGWLARELAGSGVEIEHFQLERPLSLHCARALPAAFRRLGVVLAHSHEFSMAVYGAWAARRAGIPHVITMHGGRYYAGRVQRRLALRAAIAMSARTVAVSARQADEISRDLHVKRSRILTIPNGVRYVPGQGARLRDDLRLGPDARLAVAVGNLYPVKGHQHLIDALALLADRHPTLHVAIAGRGELAAALASRAQAHGLAGRVHLLGLSSDVAGLLAAADAFVLPSLSEGLPLALLEAMFTGLPIIASDVGEVGVALAHGQAGALVPPGDVAALAAALDRLLLDPKRARELGDHASARAVREYGLPGMVQRYSAIYESLLASPTASRRGLPAGMRTTMSCPRPGP